MTNSNSNTAIHYDFVFINPDIEMLGNALMHVQNREKVLAIVEDLEREDRFITTRTFPLHLPELARLSAVRKKWEKMFAAVPHLFHTQKVIYQGQEKSGFIKSLAADSYYRNRYQKKSFKLKNIVNDEFAFINRTRRNGIVFQEYRFNVSRFFIELLKYFETAGGNVVISKFEFQNPGKLVLNKNKTVIHCDKISVNRSKHRSAFILPVTPFKNFEMITDEENITWRFFETENQLQAEQLEADKVSVSEEDLIQAGKSYFNIDSIKFSEITLPEVPSVNLIHKSVTHVSGSFPCSFNGSKMENMYDICLEKYDLAKQTGISYNHFKVLFHRYGKGVDEITEKAYEFYQHDRDALKIWKYAEQDFQNRHEWLSKE